jgi:hypothetical protein
MSAFGGKADIANRPPAISIHPPIFLVMFSVRAVKARGADPRTAQTNGSANTATNAASSGDSMLSSIEFQTRSSGEELRVRLNVRARRLKVFSHHQWNRRGNQHRSYSHIDFIK